MYVYRTVLVVVIQGEMAVSIHCEYSERLGGISTLFSCFGKPHFSTLSYMLSRNLSLSRNNVPKSRVGFDVDVNESKKQQWRLMPYSLGQSKHAYSPNNQQQFGFPVLGLVRVRVI